MTDDSRNNHSQLILIKFKLKVIGLVLKKIFWFWDIIFLNFILLRAMKFMCHLPGTGVFFRGNGVKLASN